MSNTFLKVIGKPTTIEAHTHMHMCIYTERERENKIILYQNSNALKVKTLRRENEEF